MTDGRAGNRAQALGLAQAIARRTGGSIEVKDAPLRTWAARIPAVLSWRFGARDGGWPFTSLSSSGDPLEAPWPDIVIGAGRRIAPVIAAIGKLHGARTFQLLDPGIPARAFDAVIVPEHDGRAGKGVLTTTGAMNRLDRELITNEGRGWADTFKDLPRPRVAVLIGGPSRSARFSGSDAALLYTALSDLTGDHGLIITPSRRTPSQLLQDLTQLGPNAWVWDGEGENPFPGLFAHADAVLVTEDSVNMTSEAASTGLPVHVFRLTRIDPKFRRFHERMNELGATRPFEGKLEEWDYEPLAEAERIAGALEERGWLSVR